MTTLIVAIAAAYFAGFVIGYFARGLAAGMSEPECEKECKTFPCVTREQYDAMIAREAEEFKTQRRAL